METSGQLLALSKELSGEAGVILHGISPDSGKAAFHFFGSTKPGANSILPLDIFRELEVEYDEEKSANRQVVNGKFISVTRDFSALASRPRHFRMAGKIAAFLLNNTAAGMPVPYTYDTTISVLHNLAAGEEELGHAPWTLLQCAVVLKAAFLLENGSLPEGRTPAQHEFMDNLVEAGISNAELPDCGDKYWQSLHDWLNDVIAFHHLKR